MARMEQTEPPVPLDQLERRELTARMESMAPMGRPDPLDRLALRELTEPMERLVQQAQQASRAQLVQLAPRAPPVHLPSPSTVPLLIIMPATSASAQTLPATRSIYQVALGPADP